jgi:hypothetical protein
MHSAHISGASVDEFFLGALVVIIVSEMVSAFLNSPFLLPVGASWLLWDFGIMFPFFFLLNLFLFFLVSFFLNSRLAGSALVEKIMTTLNGSGVLSISIPAGSSEIGVVVSRAPTPRVSQVASPGVKGNIQVSSSRNSHYGTVTNMDSKMVSISGKESTSNFGVSEVSVMKGAASVLPVSTVDSLQNMSVGE